MRAHFFIIDDNAKSRGKLARLLRADWPTAEIVEYDPAERGWPGEDIQWSKYDIVFLEYTLRDADGLGWFNTLGRLPGFPPTVILSATPDPDIAVRVIKSGAENYLPKRSLTREKLKQVVDEILGAAHRPPPGDATTPDAPPAPAGKRDSDKPRVIRLPEKKSRPNQWPEIEGHTLLKKIGQGGMSSIYLAERNADRQRVVLKTLSMGHIDNKKTVIRANQEYKLIGRIKNPHIVKLYEQGMIEDVLYTTMEYFPGGDLKQRLRQGISQQQALGYLRQIADGLNAIHGCGIIHRDLKPGNIMFRRDESLAIIDFGISKDINSTMDLTTPGQIMGTPNYMAPEQGRGSSRPDARSDIYSLGVMLYEMLTGKKPYAAASGAAIIYKHVHDPIPRLPNRFFELQVLIDTMMAKDPDQRFQSAYDLVQFVDSEYRWDLTLDIEW